MTVRDQIRPPTTRRQSPPGWLPWAALAAAVSAVAGAVMALAFDPERGRGRRIQTMDRAAGTLRRTGRAARRAGRMVGATAAGLGARATHLASGSAPENDATLAHKVQSELFRDPEIPKGRININAEKGCIVLRGVADSPAQIEMIELRVRDIGGVQDVRNLLHLENTPAPDDLPAASATS